MSTYTKTNWNAGKLITASLVNNIEDQLERITPGATNIAPGYSNRAQYEKGDYCLHNGTLWKCLIHCSDVEPGSNNSAQYWQSTLVMNETNSGISQSIAHKYDSNLSYQIGDYVTYHTDLYRCIASTSGGTWDDEKWELVILSRELEKLVLVQDEEPTEGVNKIWYNPDASNEVMVLTYDDLQQIILVQSAQPTNVINRLWINDQSTEFTLLTLEDRESINNIFLTQNLLFLSQWESGNLAGNIGESCTKTNSNAYKRLNNFFKFSVPVTLVSDGTYNTMLWLLDDNLKIIQKTNCDTEIKVIPANTNFQITINYHNNPALDISEILSNDINKVVVLKNIPLFTIAYPQVNWCALGDDIIKGNSVWVSLLARRNGWSITNMAVEDTGFINKTTGTTLDNTLPGWWVAQKTNFSSYNLITIAYGINDYKANVPLGALNSGDELLSEPTTIYGGIQKTIQGIFNNSVPNAKIIFITPLNIANYGNAASNYAVRHENSATTPYTLEDLADAIIECCNYYGIEYIDMTHFSCINSLNIQTALPDGVHPSLLYHELLARELAKKINFS